MSSTASQSGIAAAPALSANDRKKPGTTRRRVAIVQPNYIPWKGYFDLIDCVDEFILLDNVQFTKRDWRNRNRIRTHSGLQWLTIPVETRGRAEQLISETRIADLSWREKHWESIRRAHAQADCFSEVASFLQELYETAEFEMLTDVNQHFIDALCRFLGITTELKRASDLPVQGVQTERLVSLCGAVGASEYISGPAARAYLDEARFLAEGIGVTWFEYSGYPEYPQPFSDFVHEVSVLDLIFNTGRDALQFIRRESHRS